MKDLKSVLAGISESWDKAGGSVSRQTKLALRAHRKEKLAVAIALAVFIICCLAVSAYLLIKKGGSQESRGFATLAGIGGTGGALEALRRVWRDYSQTDLLLILMEDANEAQLTALITKLIKSL